MIKVVDINPLKYQISITCPQSPKARQNKHIQNIKKSKHDAFYCHAPHHYIKNNSLFSHLKDQDKNNSSEGNMIIAFHQYKLQKTGKALYFHPTDPYIYQITIHSDNAPKENLQFKYQLRKHKKLSDSVEVTKYSNNITLNSKLQAKDLPPETKNSTLLNSVFNQIKASPNPTKDKVNTEFSIFDIRKTKLSIYDIYDRKINTIVSQYLAPGNDNFEWITEIVPSDNVILKLSLHNKKIIKNISITE